MSIHKTVFGTLRDGRIAHLYTIENTLGMKAVLTDFGAILVSLFVPDRQGRLSDVVLGYDELEKYQENFDMLGATVGRNVNRIEKGIFHIDGIAYQLEINENDNNIHIKVVTIGGGSSYTPELIEGFIKRYHELPIREHWLVDVEAGAEKLEIVAALAQRMWDATPYKVKIYTTLDRTEALPGADFVTTQFRVGMLPARIKDERIPILHGMLGQETNGAGGIFKAFRTIPVIGQIIDDMRRLCPDAWLINFTNPSGMVTEAAIKKYGWKKTIGLCNVPVIAEMREPRNIGKGKKELTYRFAGLNHFHWHRVFDQEGRNVTKQILPFINSENGGTPVNIHMSPFPEELLSAVGDIPCGYHRYYFMEQEMLAHSLEEFRHNGTRAEKMYQVEKELFDLYRQPELKEKPPQLGKRGGAYYSDAACECISAIYNDKHLCMTVSTENRGAISCLPEDSIVECSALISAQGGTFGLGRDGSL